MYVKKTYYSGVFDLIAKNNGYRNKTELLRDYNFIPTVKTPRHRKLEIVSLLWNHLFNKKR